jgi:hypothetical protein
MDRLRILLSLLLVGLFAANISRANTIAFWNFEEGPLGSDVAVEPNAVRDASGNGNHLRTWSTWTSPTYVNDTPFDPVPATGEGNTRSLNFTPNRDLYTDGKSINSRRFSQWTIEVSFKPHVTNRWQVVVGKDGNPAGGPPPFSLKIIAHNGHLELGLVDGAGQWRTVVSDQPLRRGEWYSAAATATGTGMSLWLKESGHEEYVLQGTVAIAGAFREYAGFNRTWTVGRGMWSGGITDWFDGVIDQVRISDVVLEPTEFLAAPRPVTDAADLKARAVTVERMKEGHPHEYLALESYPLKLFEAFRLQASPNLVEWDDVEFIQQWVEEEEGTRVRLVTDLRFEEHDRHFLRAGIVRPGPGTRAQNPVLPAADPDVLLVGETAWLYPTFRSGDRRFFAFSSVDLVTWRIHGPVLDFADIPWIPSDKQAWAPGIAQKNGKFYLYYSVGPKPSSIGVAVADSPAGPFVDRGAPLLSDNGASGFEAIDAMVFTDPVTGISYLYAGGSAGSKLRIFELNADMVSFARELPVVTPPNFTEAPYVHRRGSTYYLTYSSGSWWNDTYSVHYAVSQTPVGPWIYQGAVLSSDDRHKGPGHNSILHNPRTGDWFMVYHRWNDQSGPGPYEGRRKVAIERMRYDQQGRILPVIMSDAGVGPVELGEP